MKVLDLCCGAGAASMGFHVAGWEVVGVDIENQSDYPFDFYQCDARDVLANREIVESYDLIHASFPCQLYSPLFTCLTKEYSAILEEMIPVMRSLDVPYVMENVPNSPLRKDLVLCGTMFSLPILRHRTFESNIPLGDPPYHPNHYGWVQDGFAITIAGNGGGLSKGERFSDMSTLRSRQLAMGVPWITDNRQLAEGIPPAYTAFVGSRIANYLGTQR